MLTGATPTDLIYDIIPNCMRMMHGAPVREDIDSFDEVDRAMYATLHEYSQDPVVFERGIIEDYLSTSYGMGEMQDHHLRIIASMICEQ